MTYLTITDPCWKDTTTNVTSSPGYFAVSCARTRSLNAINSTDEVLRSSSVNSIPSFSVSCSSNAALKYITA